MANQIDISETLATAEAIHEQLIHTPNLPNTVKEVLGLSIPPVAEPSSLTNNTSTPAPAPRENGNVEKFFEAGLSHNYS